jgi:hypothetical protein
MKKLLLLGLLALNGSANAALDCFNDQGQDVTWTVGAIVPNFNTEPGVYVDCAANGNELLFIQENFTGIRYTKFGLVEWTGDDATFIYQNLEIQSASSGPSVSPPHVKGPK